MKRSMLRMARPAIAGFLIVLLAGQFAQAGPVQEAKQEATQEAQNPAPQARQQPVPPMPPADETAQNVPDAPSPQPDPAMAGTQQSDPQQNSNPVGTAAAPLAKPTGVAASRPAGAAIAPAKQRRVRAIVIRVGIIVGAGVAIGTVAALSRSSSSRP